MSKERPKIAMAHLRHHLTYWVAVFAESIIRTTIEFCELLTLDESFEIPVKSIYMPVACVGLEVDYTQNKFS